MSIKNRLFSFVCGLALMLTLASLTSAQVKNVQTSSGAAPSFRSVPSGAKDEIRGGRD